MRARGDAEDTPVCPYCGELHPTDVKCAEWAPAEGRAVSPPRTDLAFHEMPALPELDLSIHEPTNRAKSPLWIGMGVVVAVLAIFGAFQAVRGIASRLASHGLTSLTLPLCAVDRVQANLGAVATIQSEALAPVEQRVDATNALLLGSSADCNAQLFAAYTSFIQYQGLCIELPASSACKDRDAARSRVVQTLTGPEQ